MQPDPETQVLLERKKRRLERVLIALTVLAIIGLTVLQTHMVRVGAGVPMVNSILVFTVININILLLFLLLFLVLRNMHRLFFERRGRTLGARLWTKLVVAFVSLSLVPTALLFFVAIQFITTSYDHWFYTNVEKTLVDSRDLGRYFTRLSEGLALDFGGLIKQEIEKKDLYRPGREKKLEAFLKDRRQRHHLSLLEVYSSEKELEAAVHAQDLEVDWMTLPSTLTFNKAALRNQPQTWVETLESGEVLRALWPLWTKSKDLAGFMVAGIQFPAPFSEELSAVERGLEGYLQLKRLRDPIKVSHYIALTVVALLIIFVSTWIGFHLAKSITGPLMDLAEATDRIAYGDYDFTIDLKSSDEIGVLVTSFNRMTKDLKAGKTELTRKNIELQESNTELDQRRRYMEIIVESVAAGVISADAEGTVMTFNNSAEEIFKVKADQVLGRRFQDLLGPEYWATLEELIAAAGNSPRGSAEKQINVKIADQGVSLVIHLSLLKDESDQNVGTVIVFDDITGLEKAQRMAAWREVARRIAHEIKNPLTPIQLSTQRLRKRYGDRFADDGQVFDECTQTIIRQVEELKRMVNEFSSFARMPEADPTPNNLAEIVEETLVLFQEGHKHIEFVFNKDPDVPAFNLDREQMKRVLINLLDNAVAAVDSNGRVEINLIFDRDLKTARIEVADDGIGITPADRSRLFEPYFSTKKSGTGLGLAIVSTIVADHNGFVRFQDNHPRGARFIIELPVRS